MQQHSRTSKKQLGVQVDLLIQKSENIITLERVLVAANGASDSVVESKYFHKIITLDDFYD